MKAKKVMIGPHEVEVLYVTTLTDAVGLFNADPNPSIQINTRLSPKEMALTLFHECLHAIVYFQGIDFEKVNEEERIVRMFECEIPELLRRNKALFKELT